MKTFIVAFVVCTLASFTAGWWLSGYGIGFWQRQLILLPLCFIGGLIYGQHERLTHQPQTRSVPPMLDCILCEDSDEFTLDQLAHHYRLFHPDQWEAANAERRHRDG